MVGTAFQPSSFAASTRPWPAMISPSSEISTGLVNPNRSIEAAICLTCFLEWVRALRGYGRSEVIARSVICVVLIAATPNLS